MRCQDWPALTSQCSHQMKIYYLEGERRTQKKNSYVKTYIPQSHLNPLFMFFSVSMYLGFLIIAVVATAVSGNQELVPLCKQKKVKDTKVKDNFYCYQRLFSSVHGSDCNTFSRLHSELSIRKSRREIQVG